MRRVNLTLLLGSAVGMLMLAAGSAVLLGWRMRHVPDELRWTFGVVLLLFGVYRLLMTYHHQRSAVHE